MTSSLSSLSSRSGSGESNEEQRRIGTMSIPCRHLTVRKRRETREEKEKIVEDVQTPGLGLLLRSMPSFNRYGIEDGNGSKPVKHVSCSHRQTVT